MTLRGAALLCTLLVGASAPALSAPPTLDDFLRRDLFRDMKLSPDGSYLAATVPLEDRDALVVLRRADLSRSAVMTMPTKNYVADFAWANDGQVVFSAAQKFGELEQPRLTGETALLDADGSSPARVLAGRRAEQKSLASNIKKPSQQVWTFLLDPLPDNPEEVLLVTQEWGSSTFPQVERMHLKTGKRMRVARSPVANHTEFLTDPQGQVRFAWGYPTELARRTYYRDGRGSDWTLLSDEAETAEVVTPVGFNAEGSIAYLQVSEANGPDALYAFDPQTGTRTRLLADDNVDPAAYFFSPTDRSLYAVLFNDGVPRIAYIDEAHPFAHLHKLMAANFEGQLVLPESFSRDGKLGLFRTSSDRNPGDFYLLDQTAGKAAMIASRSEWLDPEEMATTRPVALNARDGLPLHGFLTVPKGSEGRGMPLVVNPHGGPFGIYDDWTFETERQLLASHGYAVLQLNFRGSGNYGRSFQQAGYKSWGGLMQDDLTDATRWAIEQGIADPQRICIYGGSYGGYAALMGVAKEPELYRCAIGNVGVYDMQAMHNSGDIVRDSFGKNFLKEVLGRDDLPAISPNRLADRIKVPVFLAAGAEDERAPPKHTELMRDALKRAGVPVEAVIYKNEGHGYFQPETRKDYYTRLLAFLDRHIGAGAAAAQAPAAAASP